MELRPFHTKALSCPGCRGTPDIDSNVWSKIDETKAWWEEDSDQETFEEEKQRVAANNNLIWRKYCQKQVQKNAFTKLYVNERHHAKHGFSSLLSRRNAQLIAELTNEAHALWDEDEVGGGLIPYVNETLRIARGQPAYRRSAAASREARRQHVKPYPDTGPKPGSRLYKE